MPTKPLFHISLPDSTDSDHFAPLQIALEGLTAINEWHIERALKKSMRGEEKPIPPLYQSGVRYKEDPPGEENWCDVLECLKQGHADCLPLSTLVMVRRPASTQLMIALGDLQVGDEIWGDGLWTKVLAKVDTGYKTVLDISLSNGCGIRCSPDHRLFLVSPARGKELLVEVRAGDVKVGDLLQTANSLPGEMLSSVGARGPWRVEAVIAPAISIACGDIETDTGKFWLPESDVLVHNCDRLAAWRVAECRVFAKLFNRPDFWAEPVLKWQWIPTEIMVKKGYPRAKLPPDGVWLVHCLVRFRDGRVEDPSKILGMGGEYMENI